MYGGGGIMPDIFVGLDTAGASEYLSIVSYRGILNQFGFDYADAHRNDLETFEDYKAFEREFDVDKSLFDRFVSYANEKGVTPDTGGINLSKEVLKLRIKAYIARNIWGNDGFYSIMTDDDKVIREALVSISDTASL